jgi:hypothetical protein
LDDPVCSGAEFDNLKKQLSFNLAEKSVIKDLNIQPDAFIPVLFSLKVGGDWSFKTKDLEARAVKEKITRFNEIDGEGFTLERCRLFVNPNSSLPMVKFCVWKNVATKMNVNWWKDLQANLMLKTL